MTQTELDILIQNKNIYYIYNLKPITPENNDEYLIVVDNGYKLDLVSEGVIVLELKDWFEHSIKSDLLAWICACLNKKYIIKEHVKLLCQTKPLELRKEIDKIKSVLNMTPEESFYFLVNLTYAIQIIENHKITKYNVLKDYYKSVKSLSDPKEIMECFMVYYQPLKKLLGKYTDELLLKEKIKKISVKLKNGK